MPEKITANHRQRLAVVYVRQSTPGQVRHHQQSARIQRGLQRRARALGWDASRIRLIEDQGKSAARPGQRPGFDQLLHGVRAGEVGIVLASDVSRWATSVGIVTSVTRKRSR